MKSILLICALLAGLFLAAFASAAQISQCNLDVTLVNQDPVNAIPSEYVKVVFQLTGVGNAACGKVAFRVLPEYPFSLDPGISNEVTIQSGTYTQSYNSQATIPFTLRVDKDALDNDYKIKVQYGTVVLGSDSFLEKEFNLSVSDVRSDFEVFVQDYDSTTNTLTFDIVNVGKNDVEALSAKIPKQDIIDVKGSNQDVIGSLDAGQDTTFSYEAKPKDGSINLEISYNDQNGDRRTIQKKVEFDSSYFTGRVTTGKTSTWRWYLGILIIIGVVGWFLWKRRKKKKSSENKHKFS